MFCIALCDCYNVLYIKLVSRLMLQILINLAPVGSQSRLKYATALLFIMQPYPVKILISWQPSSFTGFSYFKQLTLRLYITFTLFSKTEMFYSQQRQFYSLQSVTEHDQTKQNSFEIKISTNLTNLV